MIEAVSDALGTMITMVGNVITAVTTGSMSALLPVFAIGIAASVILFGVHVIRKVVWGA